MSDECITISELLPEYIAGRTTVQQNAEVSCHLLTCSDCRTDYVMWLKLARDVDYTVRQAPEVSYQTAYAKLPKMRTELDKILQSGSYTMGFDIMRYVFNTIKSTYGLISLLQGGLSHVG